MLGIPPRGRYSSTWFEATNYCARLTARERQIVQLLAEGRSNKEVAQSLNIKYFVAPTKASGEKASPPLVAAFLQEYTEPEYSFGTFEVRHLKAPGVAQNWK